MQVVVTIRMYRYIDTNTINKGYRYEIIKYFFIENKYVNRKLVQLILYTHINILNLIW